MLGTEGGRDNSKSSLAHPSFPAAGGVFVHPAVKSLLSIIHHVTVPSH